VNLRHAHVKLADGEVLVVSDPSGVYECLWTIAPEQRGAATAAVKLLRASTSFSRDFPEPFDASQSEALRAAMRQLAVRRAG
jgi:hypothetical protein